MLGVDELTQIRWRQQEQKQAQQECRQRSLKQEIDSHSASVALDAGRDTSNLLAQMGNPLSSQEVERRLKLCNPRLIFERSIRYPNLIGIYINLQERTPTGAWGTVKKHICGMEAGMMPEFSVLHKKTEKVANPELIGNTKPTREVDWKTVETFADETRGWRTVLARLLKARLINQGDIDKHFPLPSRSSEKWYHQTH